MIINYKYPWLTSYSVFKQVFCLQAPELQTTLTNNKTDFELYDIFQGRPFTDCAVINRNKKKIFLLFFLSCSLLKFSPKLSDLIHVDLRPFYKYFINHKTYFCYRVISLRKIKAFSLKTEALRLQLQVMGIQRNLRGSVSNH